MDPKDQSEVEKLRHAIDCLAPLVEAGMPGRTRVAFEFRQAAPGDIDNWEPSPEQMRKALDAYRSLPQEQRQRIANGWSDDVTSPPTQAEVSDDKKDMADLQVAVAVLITNSARHGYESEKEWELMRSGCMVDVRVRFGTTKAEVLHQLERIIDGVRESYEVMIARDFVDELQCDAEFSRDQRATSVEQECGPQKSGASSEQAGSEPGCFNYTRLREWQSACNQPYRNSPGPKSLPVLLSDFTKTGDTSCPPPVASKPTGTASQRGHVLASVKRDVPKHEWESLNVAALRRNMNSSHLRKLCPRIAALGKAEKRRSRTGKPHWVVRKDFELGQLHRAMGAAA